jgi:hypothetical protein
MRIVSVQKIADELCSCFSFVGGGHFIDQAT